MEASRTNRAVTHFAITLGLCIMIGLIVSAWIVGMQIKDMRLADRYVTSKGLVERTVKSDTGVWPFFYKESGNDLVAVYSKNETDKDHLLAFIDAQGFSANEVTVGPVQVTDAQASESGADHSANRYTVHQTVTIHTTDVDKLASAGQKTADLVKSGIMFTGAGQSGIIYHFTGLNALKPEMITEATHNARTSADRFARDTGAQIGSIRSANLGIFSITAAEAGAASDQDAIAANTRADASLMKKIRVVATIDYYLTN